MLRESLWANTIGIYQIEGLKFYIRLLPVHIETEAVKPREHIASNNNADNGDCIVRSKSSF